MNTVRSILQPPNTFIMAICPCGIRADVLFRPGIMPTVEIVHKVGIGSAGDGLTIMGRSVRSSLIRDVILTLLTPCVTKWAFDAGIMIVLLTFD